MENIYEKLEHLAKNYVDSAYKNLAKSVLTSLRNGLFLSAKELSKQCFVSESTVTKFSKYLGFSGYRELLFFLKYDYQTFFSSNKDISKTKKFQDIIAWLSEHNDYIEKMATNLLLEKIQVNIFRSHQLSNAANFLNDILLGFGINAKVFNHAAQIALIDKSDYSHYVNIILFSGRDNDTLASYLLNYESFLKLNKFTWKNFLIISERQANKVEFACEQILFINDPSYVARNLSINMFASELNYKLLIKKQ